MEKIKSYKDFNDKANMAAEQSLTDHLSVNIDLFSKHMPKIEDILCKQLGVAQCLVVPVGKVEAKGDNNYILQTGYHIDVIALCSKQPKDTTVYVVPIDLKYSNAGTDRNGNPYKSAFTSMSYHPNEYDDSLGIIGVTYKKYQEHDVLYKIMALCTDDEYGALKESFFNKSKKHVLCNHMFLYVGIQGDQVIPGNYKAYDTNKLYTLLHTGGVHNEIMKSSFVQNRIQSGSDKIENTNVIVNSRQYDIKIQGADSKHNRHLPTVFLNLSSDKDNLIVYDKL